MVLLTTSPGFRPQHLEMAVKARKHVFAEKPVCVDPAGWHACVRAHEQAERQGTAIVCGTQYRRQTNYMGAMEKIREGAIGDVVSMTARYCANGTWYRPRKEGQTEAEYQLQNWMHFIWLSGDQICEQAVHNIDVMNWVMGGPPVDAFASGGRFTRPDDSQMWDSMSVDYRFSGDRLASFTCRQIPGSVSDLDNVVYGSEGTLYINAFNGGSRITDRSGKETWRMGGSIGEAYKQEHKDLVDSVVAGKPIVELKTCADSSLTAALGRVAAYTGQKVTWDFMTKESKLDLFPKDLTMDSELPTPGYAVPGQTELI